MEADQRLQLDGGGHHHEHGGIRLQHEISAKEMAREMTEEEVMRLEHMKLHEKHRGHEKMHLEMFLILVVALVIGQVFLVQWKKRYFRSYQMCTLVGMWTIPVYICYTRSWWRFIVTWAIFSVAQGALWLHANRGQIDPWTPRLVYRWFLMLHKLSYVLGVVGYFIIMGTLFGLNLIFGVRPESGMDAGILLLFYGLYYGVLGRDLAHICTDSIAAKIGYTSAEGLPKRSLDEKTCAICAQPLLLYASGDEGDESLHRLSCGHSFHEFCIRGWCVVGKSQTCPYCKEKVDLKRMFKNPWEKPHVFYGQLLDWIRYLVCWQPLIVTAVQGVNTFLGLE